MASRCSGVSTGIKWQIYRNNFYYIGHFKVVYHVDLGLIVAVVKDIVFGVHIQFDLVHFVGTVRSILGHDDSTLKLTDDKLCIIALVPIVN